jgi:ATP/maltotriose-dependent transcriptional regulator MalT
MTGGASSTRKPIRVVGRVQRAPARSGALTAQVGAVNRLTVCAEEVAASEDNASAWNEAARFRPHHTARLWAVSVGARPGSAQERSLARDHGALSSWEDSNGKKALAVALGEELMLAMTLSQWNRAEALATEVRTLVRLLFTECDSCSAEAPNLTGAELRLLPLLATHLSFPEIGKELFLSPNTVKSQAISIYRKLGVSSRREAVAGARKCGLLER